MQRVFSGVQPTGNLHLGNYLGAIRNWISIQYNFPCLFCIVDMHAITVLNKEPTKLRQNIRNVAAGLLAAGVDADQNIVFTQSSVPAHSQLAWIFNCTVQLGTLNRMTQFKEKVGRSNKNSEGVLTGLYTYPILMAADILLYKATHVPVGEDQKQHLELTRDIAQRFNKNYSVNFFVQPEAIIAGPVPRVMNLRNGRRKMSKSDPSDYTRLNITDDADTIALKVRRAKTDCSLLPDSLTELEKRPEAANLLGIYAALTGLSKEEVLINKTWPSFSSFKEELTELIISTLTPIRIAMQQLLKEPHYIDSVLRKGSERAFAVASPVLSEIYSIIGFPQQI